MSDDRKPIGRKESIPSSRVTKRGEVVAGKNMMSMTIRMQT
ncbi:hypothetical protein ACZ87_01961 [Candidatus Erwinia dacicola]|uniref:Uncharacterized protein n=1 Tax=Candidatus Erwinia dacicola TaxID=252393 RepID=A0A328TLC2_9GAMM|nr:hypothetical protein ACZ87_01961 [Candidatus Erwinia dacicola]